MLTSSATALSTTNSSMVESWTAAPDARSPLFVFLRQFHLWWEVGVTALALLLNGLVIYLTLTTRNQTMRRFSLVMLMNCFGDTTYVVFNALTMVVSGSRGGDEWEDVVFVERDGQ